MAAALCWLYIGGFHGRLRHSSTVTMPELLLGPENKIGNEACVSVRVCARERVCAIGLRDIKCMIIQERIEDYAGWKIGGKNIRRH